ncbi:MAG TPA: CAP domain-containing protein [Gemmatimonadales bacterium]|nr:CAP domain-containing protein [Gemmatimonadales bacterium]
MADDFGSMEAEVVRRVNQYRVSHRLRALRYDAQLAAVARVHSEDMARGQAPLGHDGFTGRANAVEKFLAFKEIAENVAMNNYAHARTVAVAMNGWLKSPHHRENIEGRFDVTGVGIARARDGTYYYTQLFVARRR